MRNRITHLLKDWDEVAKLPSPPVQGSAEDALARGINMLSPVELGINRELLITILTGSIDEIQRHPRLQSAPGSRGMAEIDAALQQQLRFREWAQRHQSAYICIALYPVMESETREDREEDFDW